MQYAVFLRISASYASSTRAKYVLCVLQIAFDSKVGRNERPPRVGVNLIDVIAQVFPVQLFQLRS